MDEADFYRDGGKESFRIALGRATRGQRVKMGTTCWGVDTQVDRIMTGEQRNFSRARYPFSVAENADVLESIEQARQELDPWDFDEEYACVRGGGSDTFPPALLRAATHPEPGLRLEELEADGEYFAGYDVGASGHPAILTILEPAGPQRWRQILIQQAMDSKGQGLSLPAQERFLSELLERFSRLVLVVDVTGIGMQIGQALRERFGRRRLIWMQAGSKPSDAPPQDRRGMTLAAKYALEGGEAGSLQLLHDTEQWKQFRRTRIQGEKVEQPGSKKKTHYDRFWACIYAWYGIIAGARRSPYREGNLIVIGGR
jgi:hypothetical protein